MKKYLLTVMAAMILTVALNAVETGFYAGNQSVFVLPTAYTMPKGSSAFTDYEVVFLQYAYAVNDRAHLSAAMVFPFTTDMLRTFSLGGKVNYFRRKNVESAVWASFTPDPKVVTAGNVVSVGNEKANLHIVGVMTGAIGEKDLLVDFGLGGITRFSNRVNGMVDVIFTPINVAGGSDSNFLDLGDSLNDAGIIFGIRFKGQQVSWDLGGMRIIGEDMGSLIAIPFLKATFLF